MNVWPEFGDDFVEPRLFTVSVEFLEDVVWWGYVVASQRSKFLAIKYITHLLN